MMSVWKRISSWMHSPPKFAKDCMHCQTNLSSISYYHNGNTWTSRESKLSENALGKSPLRSAHLQMAHYQGRRDSDSVDSDVDYGSVHGEHPTNYESDDSADFSGSDLQQTISTLEAQLAKLKTSVDRKSRTRKSYTEPRNFDKLAAQSSCPSCGKPGHSKGDRKCPALCSKCHNCTRLGHWEVVCRSPTVNRPASGCATPCTKWPFKTRSNKTQWTLSLGPCFSGSNGKNLSLDAVTLPIHTNGTDWS